MNRMYRKVAGWIGIAAVLFAQLAVSAFACPLQIQADGEQAAVIASAATPDDTLLLPQPALCDKHCADEQQNVNDASSPLAPVALEPAFVVTLAMLPATSLPAMTLSPPSLRRARSPPLSIRNCCFRI